MLKYSKITVCYYSSMRKLLETQTIQKMKRRRERSSARIIIFWLAQSFLVRMRRRNFRRVQRLTRFLKISPKKEFYQKMWSEKNVYKVASSPSTTRFKRTPFSRNYFYDMMICGLCGVASCIQQTLAIHLTSCWELLFWPARQLAAAFRSDLSTQSVRPLLGRL